jgi:adenylate cyclase
MRKKIARGLLVRVALANLIGATLNSVLPIRTPGSGTFLDRTGVELFAAYMVVSITVLSAYGIARVRRALRWLEEDRDPSDAEREDVLALPRLMAVISLVGWTGGALTFTVRGLVAAGPTIDVLIIVLRNVLGAATTATIAYLLVERMQRWVIGRAFADVQGSPPRSIGLRGRLVATWILGSLVPLAVIGLAFLGRDPGARASLASYAWAFVVGGAFVSIAITLAVGRSIVVPVDQVRAGLERIGAGDLDAHITVDDSTELGLLQDGFNRMVVGLRERRRLHDLFGRHVGDEVAAHALASGATLGGGQQQATALFIDIIGSTTLAETRDPEEIASLLNDMFAEVVAAVRTEGGWVNKFEGDAALCVFGPPAGDPDHAARALRAAVALRAGLRRVAERHPYIDAGIGIASGTVFAGNVGAEDRYEYTVIGDAVNQAARITELAKSRPARLLASESTIEAAYAAGRSWSVAAETVLRGRSAPTRLFEPGESAASPA